MDGLDIVFCEFEQKKEKWSYKILNADIIPFDAKWRLRLTNLALQNAITYLKTSAFFGRYIGELVNTFISKTDIKVDFIASHGHTVFHQPDNFVSNQIGDGAVIASITGIPVVSDFRSCDIALEGQGAPIVPVGDLYLFSEYVFCLNLGGIANVSCKKENADIIAYDICPINIVINKLSEKLGMTYDKDGEKAREGQIDKVLLDELNQIWYYDKEYPKTLSIGWVNKVIQPVLHRSTISLHDKMRTYYEHAAMQIAKSFQQLIDEGTKKSKALVTGGGTFNKFLMERIIDLSPVELVIPDDDTINYKEALVMAYLGVLRVTGNYNCLKSVTGAKHDSVGGAIYQGYSKTLP